MLLGGLAERFIAELGEGLRRDEAPDGPALGTRAGLIKIAGDFHHLDRHASVVFEAAVAAHHATGSTIAVRLEGGTHPLGVLAALGGVPASSVILPAPHPHQ